MTNVIKHWEKKNLQYLKKINLKLVRLKRANIGTQWQRISRKL